jgi:hypothetical protein
MPDSSRVPDRFLFESVIAQFRPVQGGQASCFLRVGVNSALQMTQFLGWAPASRPCAMVFSSAD